MGGRIPILRAGLIAAIALGLLAGSVAAVAAPGKDPGAPTSRVDINKATEAELTKVRGIGPALAKRIVEFREEHGPFRRVEDILKVRGIGEKTFQKMRDKLKVGGGK